MNFDNAEEKIIHIIEIHGFFYARVIFWGIYIIRCFVFYIWVSETPASAFHDFNKE
jgi:hypothetical protein